MKFANLATALAAATTVSSSAPSSDESTTSSPSPRLFDLRPGCQPWMWTGCGVKAKREGESAGSDASAKATYTSQIVKAVQHSKELYQAGAEPTDLTGDGYTHDAFLYDFYGSSGKAPEGAKHNETTTPGCIVLGLCDI